MRRFLVIYFEFPKSQGVFEENFVYKFMFKILSSPVLVLCLFLILWMLIDQTQILL